MSLKAVELQVAIPRTQEVARQQEGYQQRLLHDKQAVISERHLLDEAMRHRAHDVDEAPKGYIKEKQDREQRRARDHAEGDQTSQQQQKKKQGQPQVPMKDPLRGRHVDISL